MDFGIHNGLSAFFAVCFFSGLLLTMASALLGAGHDAGRGGDAGGAHADAGDLQGGHDLSLLPKHAGDAGSPLSLVNFSALMAFAMWFGGAGWAIYGFLHLPLVPALVLALGAGIAGGALVNLFLRRVLLRGQQVLNPADFLLPGTPARVVAELRAAGSGEA